jgi:hypothetical protein
MYFELRRPSESAGAQSFLSLTLPDPPNWQLFGFEQGQRRRHVLPISRRLSPGKVMRQKVPTLPLRYIAKLRLETELRALTAPGRFSGEKAGGRLFGSFAEKR